MYVYQAVCFITIILKNNFSPLRGVFFARNDETESVFEIS
jgi:hypothetical protein